MYTTKMFSEDKVKQVIDYYLNWNYSSGKIAKLFNCQPVAIYRLLVANNVNLRKSPLKAEKLFFKEYLIDLHKTLGSLLNVSNYTNTSLVVLSRLFKKWNIKTNNSINADKEMRRIRSKYFAQIIPYLDNIISLYTKDKRSAFFISKYYKLPHKLVCELVRKLDKVNLYNNKFFFSIVEYRYLVKLCKLGLEDNVIVNEMNLKFKTHSYKSHRARTLRLHFRISKLNKSKVSAGEYKIIKWLENNKLSDKFTYDIVNFKDMKNIRPLRFDFYSSEYKMAIEYNGSQHYRESKYKNLEVIQKRDKIKKNYCKEHNIKLIIIKYDENIEQRLEKELCQFVV